MLVKRTKTATSAREERSARESESGSETFDFDRHIRPECVKVTEKSLTRIVFSCVR